MLDVWTAIVNPRAAEDALGTRVEDFMKCGIAGINLRLPKNASQSDYWESLCRLVATALEAGINYGVHSWVGTRHRSGRSNANELSAIADAVGLAYMVHELNKLFGVPPLKCGVNAERDVWRGENKRANPSANRYLKRLASLLKAMIPFTDVEYLGFPDPDVHYIDSDLDGDGQKDDEVAISVQRLFALCQVMAYQSTLSDIKAVLNRAMRAWPEHDFGAFVGCGRIDKERGVIGDEDAVRELFLHHDQKLKELTFYVGNGAEKQLLVGNMHHASIYDIVVQLHKKD